MKNISFQFSAHFARMAM